MKILIVNFKSNYVEKLEQLKRACQGSKVSLESLTDETLTSQPEALLEYLKANQFDAVLHRNEHGRLFADSSVDWVRYLVSQRFPVLNVDFGYLSHYDTFMFDYYDEQLRSSIHQEWAKLEPKVKWSQAPQYVQDYRNEVFRRVARADNSLYTGKVAIWMQWNAKLLRPELGTFSQAEWVNNVAERLQALGKQVVVKHNAVIHSELYEQTVPKIKAGIPILCDREKLREKSPQLIFDKFANWNLVAGCDYHVILSSSVSNILTLCNKPVIAMGGSWFNALDIFSESADPKASLVKPTINRSAREKWINWWLSRQALKESCSDVLFETATKAIAFWHSTTGELWKYDYIYANPKRYPNYGSSNHGKAALPLVQDLKPSSVVDIGCGGNEFLKGLKSLLPDCKTVGVDPCSPKADVKASAQRLPFEAKSFQLLTSFDVLEHIQEAELPQVFKEFQRVSEYFCFCIAQKDSQKKVFNQTLHPTIKPLNWWKAQLQPYIIGCREVNGYLIGQWQ